MLKPWATRIGVSTKALKRFGCAVGTRYGREVLAVPERDSEGRLVGVCDRYVTGEKRTRKGSRRGLVMPSDLPSSIRRLIACEGGSDSLAAHDAFAADHDSLVVGRAAKSTGPADIADLAIRLGVREAVIFLDVDDTDPNAGGIKLGKHFASLGISTRLVRPPGCKDFRQWYHQDETTRESIERVIVDTAPLPTHEQWPLFVGRDGLEDLPLPWIIRDLIPDAALVGFVSPPGGGKTTVAHAIAVAVSSGTAFFTRQVRGGPVLLVTAEGRANLGPRLYAAFGSLGDAKTDMALRRLARCYSVPPLQNLAEMKTFIARVNRLGLGPPVIVVIDTLAACMVGDENDNSDMKDFVNGCRSMIDAWGCAVVILHHLRKDGVVERGSSVWKAALDVMVRVELTPPRPDAGPRFLSLKVEKARDFAPPPRIELEMCAGERAAYLRQSRVGGLDEAKASLRGEPPNPVLRTLRSNGGWMSLGELVKKTSLSRRQVQGHLAKLREQSLVKRRMTGKTAAFLAVVNNGKPKVGT